MGQHEQDDLTTGMTLQMVQLNTLGQLERGHLERGVINVAPFAVGIGEGGIGGDELAEVGEIFGEVGLWAEGPEVDVDFERRLRRCDAVVFGVEDGRLGGELGSTVQSWNHHLGNGGD